MARNLSFPPSVKPGIPRLGETPKGWSRVAFGDVLQVVERPANLDEDAEYQLIVARRNRGGIAPRERLTGREILTKSQFFVHAGDFIISKRQIVHGACGIVPPSLDGSVVSNEYAVLHAKNGLNLAFLEYFTHSLYFQQTCFHASVGVAVEKMIFRLDEWLRLEFDLPPKPVQERVVAVLSTWDGAITGVRKMIRAKRRLKQGLMQQLLTGRWRFSEFGESVDDGELPSGWTLAHFKDIAQFRGGVGFPVSDQGIHTNGIPFIKVSDMSRPGNDKFIDGSANSVSPEVAKERGWKTFPPGSVVFAKVGAALLLNRRRILRVPTLIDNNLMAAMPKPLTTSEFLYLLLLRLDLGRIVNVGALPSVNQSQIGSVTLFLPSLEEQKRIATMLGVADREFALLERKLSLLIEQKKSLMQTMFVGHVPTKV